MTGRIVSASFRTVEEQRVRAFRDCAGAFATGVCVVSAEHAGEAAGMTLNSFTSVSLDPLLVLISLMSDARTTAAIRGSGRFSLSVLGAGQRAIAVAFARRGEGFPAEHIERTPHGFEVAGAVTHIHCAVHDVVSVADHALVLGRVAEFSSRPAAPLVFHDGRFGRLHLEDATVVDHGLLERFGW